MSVIVRTTLLDAQRLFGRETKAGAGEVILELENQLTGARGYLSRVAVITADRNNVTATKVSSKSPQLAWHHQF